jgi:hypothetical protein
LNKHTWWCALSGNVHCCSSVQACRLSTHNSFSFSSLVTLRSASHSSCSWRNLSWRMGF